MSALFGCLGAPDRCLIQTMDAALSHRGAFGPVSQITECGALAWRGARGARDEGLYVEGSSAIVLSGDLLDWGPFVHPNGPLAALLAAWRTHGAAMVPNLRGMFVMAILDGGKLTLVRDGAGARTVYYARHGSQVLFAAEPKGILAVPGFDRRMRMGGLAQYLSFSFSPGGDTLLEGVHEVPLGHAITFDLAHGQDETINWFPFEQTEPGSFPGAPSADDNDPEGKWVEVCASLLHDAVAERLPSGEPPGVFLSGGLDSSLVTAEVARQSPRKVKTWAIHFGKDLPNELDFARDVAQMCGTDHEEVLIRPDDLIPALRRIVWHMDDPIGDPITAPNFLLASKASRHMGQVFNGEGGDPLFGGPKNFTMLMHHWYGGLERGPKFRERAYLASYRRAYEAVQDLLTPDARRQIDVEQDLENALTPFFETDVPASFLNKLMAINIRLKGAHLILPKVERMYGASGLKPLMPLFDERLIRLSFAMPPDMKLRRGVEKYVLKRAYDGRLPRSVIVRPKSGMRVPVHHWFQTGKMKRYARHVLSSREIKRAGIFDPARVRDLLAYRNSDGPGRYGLRIWMLLTFEIWRRIVIEREPV